MFKIENLTEDEINLILASLSELPYKLTYQLIAKITEQGNKQLKEQQGFETHIQSDKSV